MVTPRRGLKMKPRGGQGKQIIKHHNFPGECTEMCLFGLESLPLLISSVSAVYYGRHGRTLVTNIATDKGCKF